MAAYRIEINLGMVEDAADGQPGREIERILHVLGDQCWVAEGPVQTVLKDVNGNAVGCAKVQE